MSGELHWRNAPHSLSSRGPLVSNCRIQKGGFTMSKIDHRSASATSGLSADLRDWLDSEKLGRLPTLTKDGALKFLNDRGMPIRRNAVVTAFNSKELTSGIYSGKRLASEYEVMKWAISRLGTPKVEVVGA